MNMQTHLNTTHSGLRCNRSPEYEIILDEGKSPYCHSQILGPIVQNKKRYIARLVITTTSRQIHLRHITTQNALPIMKNLLWWGIQIFSENYDLKIYT